MKLAIAFALVVGTIHAQNLVTTTQRYFTSVRRNLESSADAMPAEKYNYRLTDGQMTFGEWLVHSAQRNYADCAVLKSETAQTVAALKSKDEIAKALKDSFAYCAAAVEQADESKILASPQMTNAFLHITIHNNEIYGNIVGYLRSSGIVPPSTAGRGAQTKK
jgi:hypothetical protein